MYDIEFYEYSMICDDPELLKKLENTYYDPEFDDWVKEFDEEQAQQSNTNVEMPDPDTVSWSGKPKNNTPAPSTLEEEDYEVGVDTMGIDDWEKEE